MKNQYTFLIITGLAFSGCGKDDEPVKISCVSHTQDAGWNTEDLKNKYTIQFPGNYEGTGMVGFEGNIFDKYRNDEKVKMRYAYCGALFCWEFNDTLQTPFPGSVLAKDENAAEVTLNSRKEFCRDNMTESVFYYNSEANATGKLFMKNGSLFQEALTVYFPQTDLPEVESILRTIQPD